MINVPKTKLLFFDLETVGIEQDYKTLKKNKPELAKLFESYQNWIVKRFPEEEGNSVEEMFYNKAALIPEFAKIIVASFAFYAPDGNIHKQTFSSDQEIEVLQEIKNLLTKVGKLDFYLCGHNIKNFDIPMIGKRMVINGMKPPKLFPTHDTKPWDLRVLDTKEVWQFGNNWSLGSLDLMCSVLEVDSPKNGDVKGDNVTTNYWEGKHEEIKEYCERDVKALVDIITKLNNLK